MPVLSALSRFLLNVMETAVSNLYGFDKHNSVIRMESLLNIGASAPDIDAKAWYPEKKKISEFKLSKLKGTWVILTFYPGDFTFVCATDIEAFMSNHGDFVKNGAQVYAISTDSVFSHKVWSETSPRVKESTIPLIEDFNKKVTKEHK